jgi:catechol 2,3-dioxygenase-like lactoylglutathione lyase family enzyme
MATTRTRPSKVATCIIPIADQEKAVAFYCDTLGFEVRVDVPFGPGSERWVEVGLGQESTTVALAPPPPGGSTGNRETGISLQTDDIDAYHAQLRDAGVDVDAEIMRPGEPVPPMFWFRDPEGNVLLVVQ